MSEPTRNKVRRYKREIAQLELQVSAIKRQFKARVQTLKRQRLALCVLFTLTTVALLLGALELAAAR